jgi:hypothetical protein
VSRLKQSHIKVTQKSYVLDKNEVMGDKYKARVQGFIERITY